MANKQCSRTVVDGFSVFQQPGLPYPMNHQKMENMFSLPVKFPLVVSKYFPTEDTVTAESSLWETPIEVRSEVVLLPQAKAVKKIERSFSLSTVLFWIYFLSIPV